jgi:hypothetical protein
MKSAVHVDQCSLDQPMKLYNQLLTINSQVQTGDYPPTRQHGEMIVDFAARWPSRSAGCNSWKRRAGRVQQAVAGAEPAGGVPAAEEGAVEELRAMSYGLGLGGGPPIAL